MEPGDKVQLTEDYGEHKRGDLFTIVDKAMVNDIFVVQTSPIGMIFCFYAHQLKPAERFCEVRALVEYDGKRIRLNFDWVVDEQVDADTRFEEVKDFIRKIFGVHHDLKHLDVGSPKYREQNNV